MPLSWIEPATLRLLAQCLNQMRHQGTSLVTYQNTIFMSPSLYKNAFVSCVSSGRCNYLHLSCQWKLMSGLSLTTSRQQASIKCPSHCPHALKHRNDCASQDNYIMFRVSKRTSSKYKTRAFRVRSFFFQYRLRRRLNAHHYHVIPCNAWLTTVTLS